MNSYTSTSKQLKKNLLMSVVLILSAFILIDITLVTIAKFKTSKSSWIEDKKSKIAHFTYNKKKNRDIVFLGSSSTLYHISSDYFKRQNVDVYNFGISGNYLTDYPALVYAALEQNPKNIVISLRIEDLYVRPKEIKRPLFEDLIFYKEVRDKSLFLNTLYHWAINQHAFLLYSEPIVIKSKIFYDALEPQETRRIANTKITRVNVTKPQYDCDVFSQQTIGKKTILKCSNGDGILLGQGNDFKRKETKILEKFNSNAIEIVNAYIKIIKDSGVNPIIVFEPILNNYFVYNKRKVEMVLKGEVLDLTNENLEDMFWVDANHLNRKGREMYSRIIFDTLKKVIR